MWGAIGVSVFFLLSGYGNYLSAKNGAGVKWLCKRIAHLIVPFILSFLYVAIVQIFIFQQQSSVEYMKDFFTLTIPHTTEWYLKVQILMYIFALLTINRKWSCTLLFVFTLSYVCCGFVIKLPNYWWMTAMCFPLGFAFAKFKERVMLIFSSNYFICVICASCLIALFLRLKGGSQTIILILYHLVIATFVMSFLCHFHFFNGMAWRWLGKHSIFIYLIHIGVVEACFDVQRNIWVSAALYICLTFAGAVIIGLISDLILKRLNASFNMNK